MRQAPANAVSVLTVLPQAGDMEQMREKLEQLSRELCTFQAMASEAQAEKELLAAERTQMVIELQALSACLSLHDDEEAGLHRGRFDAKAAEEAAARVARLRCALPPGSSVRALCEASEMLPFAQGLPARFAEVRSAWLAQLQDAHDTADAARAASARDRGAAEAGARAGEGADEKLRLMRGEVYTAQQEAEQARAAAEDALTHAQRADEQLQAATRAHEATLSVQARTHTEALVAQARDHGEALAAAAARAREDAVTVQAEVSRSDQEMSLVAESARARVAAAEASAAAADARAAAAVRASAKEARAHRGVLDAVRAGHAAEQRELREQVDLLADQLERLRRGGRERQGAADGAAAALLAAARAELLRVGSELSRVAAERDAARGEAARLVGDKRALQASLDEAVARLTDVMASVDTVKRRHTQLQAKMVDARQQGRQQQQAQQAQAQQGQQAQQQQQAQQGHQAQSAWQQGKQGQELGGRGAGGRGDVYRDLSRGRVVSEVLVVRQAGGGGSEAGAGTRPDPSTAHQQQAPHAHAWAPLHAHAAGARATARGGASAADDFQSPASPAPSSRIGLPSPVTDLLMLQQHRQQHRQEQLVRQARDDASEGVGHWLAAGAGAGDGVGGRASAGEEAGIARGLDAQVHRVLARLAQL